MKTNKRTILLLLTLLTSIYSSAQVHFEQGVTWQQLVEKASKEHKCIFIDCYATWCGPCKQMDREVYADTAIGKLINQVFLSVKVQMDRTSSDDEQVRSWYDQAAKLQTDYHIGAYPTLLFFNPVGKPWHKVVGYDGRPIDFVKHALEATDEDNQEYMLLAKYQKGELPEWQVRRLIEMLGDAGEKEQSAEIAQRYIRDYLLKLPDTLLFKSDNIGLIGAKLKKTTDPGFTLFYQNPDKIDKATRSGYADAILSNVITKEAVNPRVWSDAAKKAPLNDRPDWNAIYQSVKMQFNRHFADEGITDAKISWYKQTQQWHELVGAETEKVETQFLDGQGKLRPNAIDALNNIDYNYVVLHDTDQTDIVKAIGWQQKVLALKPVEPDYIDTYAQLLYQGRKEKQAEEQETKAVALKQAEYEEARISAIRRGKQGEELERYLAFWKASLDAMKTILQKMQHQQQLN